MFDMTLTATKRNSPNRKETYRRKDYRTRLLQRIFGPQSNSTTEIEITISPISPDEKSRRIQELHDSFKHTGWSEKKQAEVLALAKKLPTLK